MGTSHILRLIEKMEVEAVKDVIEMIKGHYIESHSQGNQRHHTIGTDGITY